MNRWLLKINNKLNINAISKYINYNALEDEDSIYGYIDDEESGTFQIVNKIDVIGETLVGDISFNSISIDLPYSIMYKTKSYDSLVKLTEQEVNFIFNPLDTIPADILKEKTLYYGDVNINNSYIKTKKIVLPFANFLKGNKQVSRKDNKTFNNFLFEKGSR